MDLRIDEQSGELGGASVHSSLLPSERSGESQIDLRAMRWIDPAGLVALASFAESELAVGRSVTMHAPYQTGPRNYVDRMGLGSVLSDLGATHRLGGVRARLTGSLNVLLELRRFNGKSGANSLAQMVYEVLEASEPRLAGAMHEAISEMACNAAEHSSRGHGYLAAQTTRDGRFISFAVSDSGVGFAGSLRHLGFESDRDALQAVLTQQGVTSRPSGGGTGIPTTRRLVEGRGGQFRISSLGTTAITRAGRVIWTQHTALPGTLIQGAMRSDHAPSRPA